MDKAIFFPATVRRMLGESLLMTQPGKAHYDLELYAA